MFAILAVAVILLDIVGFLLFPPYDPSATSSSAGCAYPACFINGNLEFPAPHVVIDFAPASAPPISQIVTFHPSISSTILTMWILTILILVVMIAATRGLAMRPGRLQNALEWAYESLGNFGMSLGGLEAKPFIPIFFMFFSYILVSNWSGLIPPIGKLEELRAPTSDANITIGLALVAFAYFEWQGFRRLGVRGYLGKFFPLGEFRHGLGAGIIAMFVGLIELLLEFVKPLTLSMRLFGNIYGGEVALGVMTALTVAFVPLAILGLELMLNFVQALIFSVLTLMFTVIAIESHGGEDHAEPASHGEAIPAVATAH